MRKVELTQKDGNVVLLVKGKEVFSRPKTEQTVAIANSLYFGYKYGESEKATH